MPTKDKEVICELRGHHKWERHMHPDGDAYMFVCDICRTRRGTVPEELSHNLYPGDVVVYGFDGREAVVKFPFLDSTASVMFRDGTPGEFPNSSLLLQDRACRL